jgi:peroxiredoxin
MLGKGRKAPWFEATRLDGGTESLDGILSKGPAVLVFFKAGCPTCQLTLPFLQRINGNRAENATDAPRIIAVSQDDAFITTEFNRHFKVDLPTLLDGKPYRASNGFEITNVPSVFSIAADGTVEHAFSGFVKTELEELGRRFGTETFRPGERVPAIKPG